MSIRIGGIDLASTTINNERRILVLEKLVERLLNQTGGAGLSQADVKRLNDEAFRELQQKYPEAGLSQS